MTIDLATTRLKEFWPQSDSLLLLGKWCLQEDDPWNDNDYEILPLPWNDIGRFERAAEYTDQVYEQVLIKLAQSLNDLHDVNKSLRYWRIIIGPWLYTFVVAVYDRYHCIEEVRRLDSSINTIGLRKECYKTPIDYQNFMQLIGTDIYNLQLYTQILETLGYKSPHKNYRGGKHFSPKFLLYGYLKKIALWMHKFISEKMLKNASLIGFVINIPVWYAIKIWADSGFKIVPSPSFRENIRGSSPRNDNMRRQIGDSQDSKDEFREILSNLLAINMPSAYLEEFNARSISQKCTNRHPRMILSDSRWYSHENFKYYAAQMAEMGGSVCTTQHGSCYGMLKYHPLEKHEQIIGDKFYSWGWKKGIDNKAKIQPMPALKLARYHRVEKNRDITSEKKSIVLVTTLQNRYFNRFSSVPHGPQLYNYFFWGFRFVDCLEKKVHKKLIVRLYLRSFGWNVRKLWLDRFPNIVFDSLDKKFSHHLESASLLIIDHMGTTMLEALACDVPFISFWDTAYTQLRPAAKPYFDQLRQVGIHHDTPESAAVKLNEIHEDPASWWQQREIVAVKNRFSHQFARTSEDWLKVWKEELLNQI